MFLLEDKLCNLGKDFLRQIRMKVVDNVENGISDVLLDDYFVFAPHHELFSKISDGLGHFHQVDLLRIFSGQFL